MTEANHPTVPNANGEAVVEFERHAVGISRRQWLGIIPATVIAGTVAPSVFGDDDATKPEPKGGSLWPEFPAQPPELAAAIVGASHTRIDRVRELLAERPALARASWDWGFGDWESALGAASHMGRGDIATLLMEHGARPDIFTLAMMGKLAAVKAFVAAMPGIQRTLGPHGITLLQHAKAGIRYDGNSDEHRDGAREVETYLESLGDADKGQPIDGLSDEQKQAYVGQYVYGKGADEFFDIAINRRGLVTLKLGAEGTPRNLFHAGEHTFNPGGVFEVRVVFDVKDGRAESLTIHDPGTVITARRK